ncbi:MAG: VOC family protein [Xanthomonadales bacterium]|nr:VOC family protein [Xanthomonadales bacterium]
MTLGTRDLDTNAKFYDEVLGMLGAKRYMEEPGKFIAWSTSENAPGIGLTYPFDGQQATVGNGTMVALFAGSKENVDAIHAKALELGGKDEGAPGPRTENFYAGYFRDLDGNKLNVFCGGV